MKDFEIKLVPENSYYPVHDISYSDGEYTHVMTNPNTGEVTYSIGSVIPKIYHENYDFELTSDWYEDTSGEIVISGEDSVIIAGLNTRVGEITVNVDFDAPAGQVETDTIVRIGGDLGTHRGVKYADDGYLVEVEKQFYESEDYTVFINPTNITETVNIYLDRKASSWSELTYTEPVPFEIDYIEDINTRPENSFIDVHGVDGIRTFTEEREYIESIWTGLILNQSSEITTTPVTQIEVIGTAVIEWVERTRTETIPYEVIYQETDDLYEGDTEIGTPGRNGVTVYAWEVELMNGDETGNKTDEVIKSQQARIDEVILVGTKPIVMVKFTGNRTVYNSSIGGDGDTWYSVYWPWVRTLNPSEIYTLKTKSPNTVDITVRIVNADSNTTSIVGTIPAYGSVEILGSQLINSSYPDGVTNTGARFKDINNIRDNLTLEVWGPE